MVFEQTATGLHPLAGIDVEARGFFVGNVPVKTRTDATGRYKLTSLPIMTSLPPAGTSQVEVRVVATGYAGFARLVLVKDETRFDIELVRPGTYTLSGVITEMTPNGPAPVEGAQVYVAACDAAGPYCASDTPYYAWQYAVTGPNGAYSFSGLWAGQATTFSVSKAGYVVDGPRPTVWCEGCDRIVTASVDTQLDLQLIRQ